MAERGSARKRAFIDGDGLSWSVREMAATDVPGAQAERCLIFDSEMICRRRWRFPSNWYELPDGELERLNGPSRRGDGVRLA